MEICKLSKVQLWTFIVNVKELSQGKEIFVMENLLGNLLGGRLECRRSDLKTYERGLVQHLQP